MHAHVGVFRYMQEQKKKEMRTSPLPPSPPHSIPPTHLSAHDLDVLMKAFDTDGDSQVS